MRIAYYIRISISDGDLGKDQKDESNSIENQRLLLQAYVEARPEWCDYEIAEYVDDGYSGTNFDRPGFIRMIEDAKKGAIQIILVKDLSRLGRDYIGVGDYMEQIFPMLGIRLIAPNAYYDSDDYIGTTMGMDVSVNNLVNHLYSRDISKKLTSALHTKWSQGQSTAANIPFGYVKGSGKEWTVDPEAAKIVRTAFEKAKMGWPLTRIVNYMNEQKMPTAGKYKELYYGKKYNRKIEDSEWLWDNTKVRYIITNYAYTGAFVNGKYKRLAVGKAHVKKTNPEEQYIAENAHPAIVTHEEYKKAQLVLKNGSKPQYRMKRDDLLTGKVRCGNCKLMLSLSESQEGRRFFCNHKRMAGEQSQCNGKVYSVPDLERTVFEALRVQLRTLTVVSDEIQKMFKKSDRPDDSVAVMKKIEQYKMERIRRYEAYADGLIAREEYFRQKEGLTHKIENLQQMQSERTKERERDKEISQTLRDFLNAAEEQSKKRKLSREMVEAFIGCVYVYDVDEIEINFAFDDVLQRAADRLCESKGEQFVVTERIGKIDRTA